MKQMQAYYPHQEFADETVDGYLFDMRRLAAKHGLQQVRTCLLGLRLRPGQKFFPHPTEVAEELEVMSKVDRKQWIATNPYVPCVGETHYAAGFVRRDDGMLECQCHIEWVKRLREAVGK